MNATVFNKIEPRTVHHEVVDLIRDAIISGALEPGEHLTESVMASQMAVSRAPIREALRPLEAARQAVAAGDLDELTRIDIAFREFICIKAGHSRLLKAWYAQHAQSRMLLNRRFRALSDYTPETVVRDHTQIVNALERRDAAAAIALTKENCARVERECIQILRRRTQPSVG